MNSIERILATGIIWLAVAGITIAMAFTQDSLSSFLVVVLLAGGFLSTAVVWGTSVALTSNANNAKAAQQRREPQSYEKPKRSNQDPSLWMNDLDSEQLAALESALAARRKHLDEDDQIEINRLLAEQDNARKGF